MGFEVVEGNGDVGVGNKEEDIVGESGSGVVETVRRYGEISSKCIGEAHDLFPRHVIFAEISSCFIPD